MNLASPVIPISCQIASRIQELKVRARDVDDRWLRYSVTMPALDAKATGVAADTYYGHDDDQSP